MWKDLKLILGIVAVGWIAISLVRFAWDHPLGREGDIGPVATRAWWAERRCRLNLQGDLNETMGPAKDPTVTRCTGDQRYATCFIKVLESGAYQTRAMTVDCSRRYMDEGILEQSRTSPVAEKRWKVQADAFGAKAHLSY